MYCTVTIIDVFFLTAAMPAVSRFRVVVVDVTAVFGVHGEGRVALRDTEEG